MNRGHSERRGIARTKDMNEDKTSSDAPADSTETLRELMDDKARIKGGINPAREHELDALLRGLQGVQTVAVVGDDVTITYDPTEITAKEMHERMNGAGFVLEETETATCAPSVAQ